MQQWKSWGPFVIRLTLGGIFIHAGWGKLMDAGGWLFRGEAFGFAGMVEFMPLLPAGLWALAVTFAEFLGGICVLIGYKVRIASVFLATVMLGAIFAIKLPGPGFLDARVDIALFTLAVSLILTGAGKLAIESN